MKSWQNKNIIPRTKKMHNTDPIKKPGFHYAQSLVFCVVYCGQLSFWTSVLSFRTSDYPFSNAYRLINCFPAVHIINKFQIISLFIYFRILLLYIFKCWIIKMCNDMCLHLYKTIYSGFIWVYQLKVQIKEWRQTIALTNWGS